MSAKEQREALENLAEDGTLARHDRRDGSFVITVPGPLYEHLGPNDRSPWMVKRPFTKAYRLAWKIAVLGSGRVAEQMAAYGLPAAIPLVRLTYRAYLCRKRWTPDDPLVSMEGYRPKDIDNLEGAMKPAQDGLRDAGLFADDTAKHVKHGEHSITELESFGKERVEILVEPLEQGGVG